ncbi:Outer membrane protein OmpA [Nocardiopsis flavescens]|uniref:Outer membrane protein OmpA n=1 Tax=Nocardiopsis flavescens TaxID=758803 RepID=A0A1M6V576_9ACTN|nr:OmpA family protein [Nocardiopsis flavescens]SHK76618.1 Outer membrane protein OmpA [Nocardiopsis flavescens]
MHPLNRLGAAVFALVFLIGIPYALLWHATWPETLPSWDVALAHLRGWRLPPGVAAAALITALWALWGMFALALAAEVVARLRGVPLRLRPFGPLQAIAATAVAATAVTPAAAFADTVVQEDGAQEEQAPEGGAPAAPQSAAEQGPVERSRTVSGFAVGSAELTDRMREDLAPTVEMIGDHWDENVPVAITGHTDPSGNADRNQELSEERAQAVADYLEEELGEDAPDTEVEGVGSEQQVEGPAEAQRRVEISYTLAPAPAPAAPQEEAGGGQDRDTEDEAAATDGAEVAAEVAQSVVTVENASAVTEDDGPRVVVVEIPDGAVAGVVGFAGLAGGYLLGKRGSFVPRMALSLPRRLTGRPRRLELTQGPPRPEPADEIDERVTVELDHVPGLGLTGKGADAAARRLIANALDPSEPLAVRVLITDDEAVRLLGETGRDLLRDNPCEPVTLVATTEDALTVLASELHAMADEDRAPLALIISAPDARHEHALSGLLLHGQQRGITAVILGSWPLGGNCVVDADGLISQTSQPLATLFHCSWAGATPEEVHEAVRTYHSADHSVSERPQRASRSRMKAERRPVLVAEDWEDDDAFVPVGDDAVWERLTRAWDEEAAESGAEEDARWAEDEDDLWSRRDEEEEEVSAARGEPAPAPASQDDGASVDAAFRALREGEYGRPGAPAETAPPRAEAFEEEDDSWWDETPVEQAAAVAPAADDSRVRDTAAHARDREDSDGLRAEADDAADTGDAWGPAERAVPAAHSGRSVRPGAAGAAGDRADDAADARDSGADTASDAGDASADPVRAGGADRPSVDVREAENAGERAAPAAHSGRSIRPGAAGAAGGAAGREAAADAVAGQGSEGPAVAGAEVPRPGRSVRPDASAALRSVDAREAGASAEEAAPAVRPGRSVRPDTAADADTGAREPRDTAEQAAPAVRPGRSIRPEVPVRGSGAPSAPERDDTAPAVDTREAGEAAPAEPGRDDRPEAAHPADAPVRDTAEPVVEPQAPEASADDAGAVRDAADAADAPVRAHEEHGRADEAVTADAPNTDVAAAPSAVDAPAPEPAPAEAAAPAGDARVRDDAPEAEPEDTGHAAADAADRPSDEGGALSVDAFAVLSGGPPAAAPPAAGRAAGAPAVRRGTRPAGAAAPSGGGTAAATAPAPRREPGPAAPEEPRKQVRHQRAPGRKAGRVRVVRVDRPEPSEHGEAETSAVPVPARLAEPRGMRPGRAAATAARPRQEKARRLVEREPAPGPLDDAEAAPAYRPQPAKPHKAGRGRVWKPRDDA